MNEAGAPSPLYNKPLFWGVLVVFLLLALLKLWPLLHDYDAVAVAHTGGAGAGSDTGSGSKLDQVLLKNLAYFSQSGLFHSALSGGARQAKISRPFWMDRCEVKQGDFYKFSQWQPFYPGRVPRAEGQPDNWRFQSETEDHTISGRLHVPTNAVTWFDAYSYCGAAGGRLPGLGEWIAAAAGQEGRLYPWGDTFKDEGWPYLDPLLNAAQQCGLHPETDTPEGIADMGHNVAEWVSSSSQPQLGVIAGGNAYSAPREVHSLAALYRTAPRTFRSPYIGFRCVYDSQPPQQTNWRTDLNALPVAAGDYAVGMPEGSRLPDLIIAIPGGKLPLVEKIFTANQKRQASGGRQDETALLFVTRGEITRRLYAAFLRDPFVKMGLYAEASEPEDHSYEPPDWNEQRYQLDQPVVSLDWWSAYAFAAWAGGRLPTATEWAGIASGQGRRLYPWGDAVGDVDVISGERRSGGSQAFSEARGDVTPDGVYDLGGNVSEWTRSATSTDGVYTLIIKGGNYLLPAKTTARFDYENQVPPHYRSKTLGFRVIFDRN